MESYIGTPILAFGTLIIDFIIGFVLTFFIKGGFWSITLAFLENYLRTKANLNCDEGDDDSNFNERSRN